MTWEYKVIYKNAQKRTSTGLPDDINIAFDRYGAEGWELVRVEPKLHGGFMALGFGSFHQTVGYIAFFKRPKA